MSEYTNTLASPSVDYDGIDAGLSDRCLDNDSILAFAQGLLTNERREQVHWHIDQCGLCQRLVNEAVHALDSEPLSESRRPSWNAVFQRNTVVGRRYRIIRLIARGGMGEVYEAFDTELQERLAIKTVTSTACDSTQAVRLLKAEVQLARRISHPNVCRIYDFRTHEMESSSGAINYLVMEYVEGECLGRRLRDLGALPVDQALSIAHQLLLGLHAAHQEGVLHRDFKSDNVMLRTKSDGRIVPVILDFGLAKALNESGDASSTLNQGHGMVGTIGYMSPEQVEGHQLSKASDIYSFGVVWFELLTGRLPFVGESPLAAALARLQKAPPPPSSINPQVPGWLDDLVLRCLSRSQGNRFSSAQQVLDALALQPPPLSRSSRISWLTRRGWVGACLLALVCMPLAIRTLAPPRSVPPAGSATPAPTLPLAPPALVGTSRHIGDDTQPPAQDPGPQGSVASDPQDTTPPKRVPVKVGPVKPRRTVPATAPPPSASLVSPPATEPDWLSLEPKSELTSSK